MEVTLLVSASLSLLTSAIIFVYFRKMKEISRRYVEAKDIVGHVILSFKADLQKQGDRILSVSQAVESLSSKTRGSKMFQEFRGELNGIRDGLSSSSDSVVRLSAETDELTKRVERLMSQQLEDEKKIALLESSRGKDAGVGERIQAAIPITKDAALSGLTDTELRVLEILATEGEKTANRIREEIDLTREHTGRLMKSLYARGYAERRTDRLPYTYRIKGEMLNILKKSRANSRAT
jgi:hypothetical protein